VAYTIAIFLAVGAAVIYGLLGVCFQVAGERRLEIPGFLFWKQLIGAFLAAGVCLIAGIPQLRGGLVMLSLLAALSYVVTVGAYLMATREREIGASWTVLNLSVILPIGVSVFWFGDRFIVWKALGVILTIASVVSKRHTGHSMVMIYGYGRDSRLFGWPVKQGLDSYSDAREPS